MAAALASRLSGLSLTTSVSSEGSGLVCGGWPSPSRDVVGSAVNCVAAAAPACFAATQPGLAWTHTGLFRGQDTAHALHGCVRVGAWTQGWTLARRRFLRFGPRRALPYPRSRSGWRLGPLHCCAAREAAKGGCGWLSARLITSPWLVRPSEPVGPGSQSTRRPWSRGVARRQATAARPAPPSFPPTLLQSLTRPPARPPHTH